jgi:hypothetical protein
MIQVITHNERENTAEAIGAKRIRNAILDAWPQAAADDRYRITLIPNALCPGQKRSEIDLILIVECPEDASFTPTGPFIGPSGNPFDPSEVIIRSLVACIEIKEHPASAVRFTGTAVQVYYADTGWSNATLQSHEQKTALASFLQRQGLRAPLVRNALWLPNVYPHESTGFCENVVLANLRWDVLLQAMLAERPPYFSTSLRTHVVDAFNLMGESSYPCDRPGDVEAVFLTEATPTELDRHRMERLGREASARAVQEKNLDNIVGGKMLLIRGAGGTGKTVLLLQLARHLYETQDARVALLTYNRSLVADITRLLALLRLDRGVRDRTIAVQTVHSFLWEAAHVLTGVGDEDAVGDFEARYDAAKKELLDLIASGALTGDDIEAKKAAHEGLFFYDYVFIDEGQDFPDDERDLLLKFFGHMNLVISEGPGQLVRRTAPTDWRGGLAKSQVAVHWCRDCLRMKANIARFATRFADALGVEGALSVPAPNDAVPGGRVIVVEGDYFSDTSLHDDLTRSLRRASNLPMDQLFCVPPTMVTHSDGGVVGEARTSRSRIAEQLQAQGVPVWDAVDGRVRGTAPGDLEAFRVVTYESCRGLEGWNVVLCQLDDFYDDKVRLAASAGDGSAAETAALWVIMAVMRAMDTLIITLKPDDSAIRTALKRIQPQCRDFLEWRQTPYP